MTVPLRSGDPITVNVALGDRAYDIAIGRGLLATLGEKVAEVSKRWFRIRETYCDKGWTELFIVLGPRQPASTTTTAAPAS